MNKNKPLAVIRCLTYNHEPYIRDCLEGFVMQKTDFQFVAIVHDDASTDGTACIIREFAERYPGIIKPIYETENQYSRHDGSLGNIINGACEATGARYIAMCEGDDYWTDPFKLQKQVDFLEAHPDFSMCFHNVKIDYHGSKTKNVNIERQLCRLSTREYSIIEIIKNWTVPTCSAVLKANCFDERIINKDIYAGDNALWVSCLTKGKSFCINEKMGVYRIVNSGWINNHIITKNSRKEILAKWILHYQTLAGAFPEEKTGILKEQEIKHAVLLTFTDIKDIKYVYKKMTQYYDSYKSQYLKEILKVLKDKIVRVIKS